MSPLRRTALASVVAAICLIAIKLVTGLAAGSLGLVADAAHSGTDLVAALLIAGGDADAMKRRCAARQVQGADVVAVAEKLGKHKITHNGTSFLYTRAPPRATYC